MAKILIVYAHPEAPSSFNFDLKERLAERLGARGHTVSVRDLYASGFDPVLSSDDLAAIKGKSVPDDIKTEQSFVRDADAMVFIYPIWWSGPPAMAKGYFDRVMTNGFAYEFRGGVKAGLLSGRRAIVVNSHGNAAKDYDERGYYAAMKLLADDGVLKYCGFDAVEHIFYGGMAAKPREEKETDIEGAVEAVAGFIEKDGAADDR